MSSVLRITYLHFSAGAWRRWPMLAGLAIIAYCIFDSLTVAKPTSLPLGFVGCIAVFFGSSLMPVTVHRLMRSHQLCVLPFGRMKLLLSALLTTALVSLPLPLLSALTMRASFPWYRNQSFLEFLHSPIFLQMYAIVFLNCTWMYFVHWLLTTGRTAFGFIRTILVLIALLALPPRFISLAPDKSNYAPLVTIAISWAAFALYEFNWCLLHDFMSQRLKSRRNVVDWFFHRANFAVGRELQLMLGIGNRWIYASAVILVIALDTMFVREHAVWLFFLALLAVVAGAISGIAATRSRGLWLRRPWSRDELFAKIERFMWRQTILSLAALLLWFVAMCFYVSLPLAFITSGAGHIALTFSLCTYLGLMQTRGLRWADGLTAIAITVLAMLLAVYTARADARFTLIFALEAVMVALVFVFRRIAVQRWHNLDWILCRPTLATRT